jgi:hypothetical protein
VLVLAAGLLLAAPANAQLPVDVTRLGERVSAAAGSLTAAGSDAGVAGQLSGGGAATISAPVQHAPGVASGSGTIGAVHGPAPVSGAATGRPEGVVEAGLELVMKIERVPAKGDKPDVEGAAKQALAALERAKAAAEGTLRETRVGAPSLLTGWDAFRVAGAPVDAAGRPARIAGAATAPRASGAVVTFPVAGHGPGYRGRALARRANGPAAARTSSFSPAAAEAADAPANTTLPGGSGASASALAGTAAAILLGAWLLALAGRWTSLRLAGAVSPPLGFSSVLERPG